VLPQTQREMVKISESVQKSLAEPVSKTCIQKDIKKYVRSLQNLPSYQGLHVPVYGSA
jgi:ribosomal protein S19